MAARPSPVAPHKPIEAAEAKAELRASKVEKGSALTRNIEALSATTEALLRQLDADRAPAPAAAINGREGLTRKAKGRKLAATPPAAKRTVRTASGVPALPASAPVGGKRRPPTRAKSC